MANILNTRIRLKYDTLANWSSNNPTLLEGELAIVSIPNGATQEVNSVSAPQILFKVGPGEFNSLPYASGKAADVYTWAKLAGADVFKKDGNGNVVSGIEYDATANDGKGGFKFTTASVATSEGLEEVNNALAELMAEVYGEDGSANASRIDALEERMTAEENKVDNDTTYTFAKTEKGFSVTPKGGEAQTISFEYLTTEEVASAIEAYGYKDEAGVKAIVEAYGYATLESLNGVDAKFASYRTSEAQDAIDATFATKEDVAGIESEGTVVTAIRTASGAIIGDGDTFQMITDHDIAIKSVDGGSVEVEGGYVSVSGDRVEILGDVTVSGYRTSEAQDAIDATFATKTELGGVDGRVSTLEGSVANWNDKYTKEEIDGKVNAINEAINGKVAQSDYNTKMGEIDGSISSINGTLATKADASSLNNYYTKEETYNSTTIDSKIEAAEGRANGYADKAVSDFKDFLLGNGATDAIDTIKDLADALSTHEDAYDALLETVGKKAEKTYVDEEIGKVSKSVTDLGTSTDTRLDAIEAQLGLGGGDSDTGSVTEQLAAHALTLEDHESRIAANEGAIKTINETTIPGLDSRIKTLEDNPYELPSDVVQDANYKHITVTETSVSDGTTTFTKYDDTALAGRVSDLEENINLALNGGDSSVGIYDRLTGIETNLDDNIGPRLNVVEEGFHNCQERVEATENAIETVTIELYGDSESENPGLVNRVEDIELALNGTSSADPGLFHRVSVLEHSVIEGDLNTKVGKLNEVVFNGSKGPIDERVEQTEGSIDSLINLIGKEYRDSGEEPIVDRLDTLEQKPVVEYYEAEQPDYTKNMFVICCGSSSDLI